MRLSQLRQKASFSLCIASAFLAVQLVGTAQQTVPFDGAIPVAPAGFEPLPIPAEPLEFDTAEVMRIRVVPIARQLVNPWSLAFLPPSTSLGTGASDVTMLVTEKEGRLRIIRNGVLDPKPIPGVPTVRVQGRSGLMEVLLHPQFATNRFVYFTYLKPVNEKQTALTVARGRFDGSAISELKDIFSCGPGVSGPSRLAWGRDGKLYMTTPSSGNGSSSQDPNTYAGKVLRLNDDGTVPADNPFNGRVGHKPEVYTFGHRNSLGLAVNPTTGELWQNEMGPNGGDEINILKPGANYGWPLVSLGRSYPGPWQSPTFSKDGFESPVVYWMPSISLSGMTFYTGSKLPKWKGDIFVGGQRTGEIPGTGHLERVLVNDKLEELRREALLVPLRMRIRDVRQGPDELLYVLVDHENGGVLRIEPSATPQAPTNYSARPPR
ncbi:MAG TPA: PQQ-dependent sugar dehydrogenase [Vicinamibacterales bacterium]|nr:PQQ-dependent sugar dehydrogenase [Vicinamibacterales bacterium]